MRSAFWLVVGIALGFVAAHQVARTPQGRQLFDDLNVKAREFSEAVVDGYRARETELRAAVADAEHVIADLSARVK